MNAIVTGAQARAGHDAHERPRDQHAEGEQPDREHRGEERDEAQADQAGRGSRLRERGDHELRRGPGDGPTANVNAPRTGWPSAEITRQITRYQPGGSFWSGSTSVCGAPGWRAGDPLVTCWPVHVGHRDDREARLDRLRVGERDLRGRPVRDDARGRARVQQRRVRAGDRGQHEAESHEHPDDQADAHAAGHATGRRPAKMPPMPTSRPAAASTSATIVSVSVEPPPPRSDTARTVGAGVSEPSAPDQSTTVPSE